MRACALIVNKELTFTGMIELSRFMTTLKFVASPLTQDQIWYLAKMS